MVGTLRMALCAVLLFMASAVAVQAKCTLDYYKKCWAGIAVGPEGEFGAMTHAFDKDEAVSGAFRSCGGTCNGHYWFFNRCGAVAYGGDGVWGFGSTVRNIPRARKKAIADCIRNGGAACGIRFEACSRP